MTIRDESLPLGMDEQGDVVTPDTFVPVNQEAFDDREYLLREHRVMGIDQAGPSVKLTDRAMAIASIMRFYNKCNRLKGARESGVLSARYGNRAGTVEEGMIRNAYNLHRGYAEAVDTLVARNAMLEAGYSATDIGQLSKEITGDLEEKYGPGKAYAKDREKLVKKVKKTAGL